ncbi:RCC1 domain-containing protein [Hymenobacter sp. BRD67]|uniref:RCC1 domain-containing protein n=1 Tax=Hymenobacter sp. BRD67 TaxID=2675877 RepID=UPI0020B74AC6|nr:hypothetical protein [Hymenobacter sp. BRD67]
MPTGTRLVQVAAGKLFSLALAADGTAYAWGDNASGQLGNSTTASSQVPVAVSLPTGGRFVQVAAGQLHALALAADGSLYAWGGNASGQLGNGTTAPSTAPVPVSQGAARPAPASCRWPLAPRIRWPWPPMVASTPGATTPAASWATPPTPAAVRRWP